MVKKAKHIIVIIFLIINFICAGIFFYFANEKLFYDYTNWNELIFNDTIPYDIKNKKNFSYEKGYSNSIYEYKFHVKNIDLQCLFLVIYDSIIGEENEVLFLIFYDNINENDFYKLIISYTWGGSLK